MRATSARPCPAPAPAPAGHLKLRGLLLNMLKHFLGRVQRVTPQVGPRRCCYCFFAVARHASNGLNTRFLSIRHPRRGEHEQYVRPYPEVHGTGAARTAPGAARPGPGCGAGGAEAAASVGVYGAAHGAPRGVGRESGRAQRVADVAHVECCAIQRWR
jgi:hypothetical protein